MAVFVDGQHRTDYGRIVLTTGNVLHSAPRVVDTPSRADGISYEVSFIVIDKILQNINFGHII